MQPVGTAQGAAGLTHDRHWRAVVSHDAYIRYRSSACAQRSFANCGNCVLLFPCYATHIPTSTRASFNETISISALHPLLRHSLQLLCPLLCHQDNFPALVALSSSSCCAFYCRRLRQHALLPPALLQPLQPYAGAQQRIAAAQPFCCEGRRCMLAVNAAWGEAKCRPCCARPARRPSAVRQRPARERRR